MRHWIFFLLGMVFRVLFSAWTTPKTWSSEPMTSPDLNTYVRDNQNYLKDRLENTDTTDQYATQVTASTTSASYVDIDATNLVFTMTTLGGDVQVTILATGHNTTASHHAKIAVDVDSTDYPISRSDRDSSGEEQNMNGTIIINGLSAGSHTFRLQFLASTTGTAEVTVDLFDVREIMGDAT